MTTWTMDQVRQARGLYAVARVDTEMLDRYGDGVRQVTASKMARRLREDAHAFAIELDDRDFEVQWSEVEGQPWNMEVKMRWNPPTREVEMRGGHADGQRVAIQRVGDPIRLSRPASHVGMFDGAARFPDDTLTMISDTYEMVGWREDERVWVYASSE